MSTTSTTTARPVKFAHLWLVNPETLKVGRATLAFFAEDRKLTAAVAFCDPNDRYYRDEGRKRAVAALEAGKTMTTEIPKEEEWRPASALAEVLLGVTFGHEQSNVRVPKWARRAFPGFNGEIVGSKVIQAYRPTFDCRDSRSWEVKGPNGFKAGPFPTQKAANDAADLLAANPALKGQLRVKRERAVPEVPVTPAPLAFVAEEVGLA